MRCNSARSSGHQKANTPIHKARSKLCGRNATSCNVLRTRANATPATAAEMNMDYILDERLRELYLEEFRAVTLTRLGLLYDRDKRYNPRSGLTIEPHHNLWPIPANEITQNTGAELKQNDLYQ